MKLRLGGIGEGQSRVALREDPQALGLSWKDGQFRSPIHLELEILRRGDRFFAQGEITTQVDAKCSKCLREFTLPLRAPFRLTIRLSPEGGRDDDTEGDFLLLSPRTEALEIGERVRQFILLALPLKPLCRPDCRGLCPICGKDLNEGECNCRGKAPDSRWEKLKSLKEKGFKTTGESSQRG